MEKAILMNQLVLLKAAEYNKDIPYSLLLDIRLQIAFTEARLKALV